ncbi:MAG: TIGR03435 family protein, partial [Acidobacteria bacterium]|nr:TIGR03435 family protein [Acidobacteriota bacterium]
MRGSFVYGLAWLALLAGPRVAAQPKAAAPLTFEVASVKMAATGGVEGGCHGIDFKSRPGDEEAPLGRCVITGARLSHLIGIAFGVSMQDLSTGPDWIQRGYLRFDVNAKAEDPAKTTQRQLLTMLQNLLIERFHLKFHYRTSEVAGFRLTVAK